MILNELEEESQINSSFWNLANQVQSHLQSWADELETAFSTLQNNIALIDHPDIESPTTSTVIYGNPLKYTGFEYNHAQGRNNYNADGDCSLVATEDTLMQFGIRVTENAIVGHAKQHNEAGFSATNAGVSGEATAEENVQLLADYGVQAHVEENNTVDHLADEVQQGHSAQITVNANSLWHDGSTDVGYHAVNVTGVARDSITNEVQGFYINDSGADKSGEFVSVKTMKEAWIDIGGESVITDNVHH